MGRKKGHHAEHVNHERWLVSYADFITLLFAFFVVMYAISDLNSRKAKQVSQSVRFAMHYSGTGGTKEAGVFSGRGSTAANEQPGGQLGTVDQWVRETTAVYEFLTKEMGEDFVSAGEPKRRLDERGVVITLTARTLFEPGSSHPNEKAKRVLEKAAEGARRYHKDLVVSGITARARLPEGNPHRDTIDLQLARLAALERVLTDQLQWPPDRVSISAMTKKTATGAYASPAQVERASKIEIVILR